MRRRTIKRDQVNVVIHRGQGCELDVEAPRRAREEGAHTDVRNLRELRRHLRAPSHLLPTPRAFECAPRDEVLLHRICQCHVSGVNALFHEVLRALRHDHGVEMFQARGVRLPGSQDDAVCAGDVRESSGLVKPWGLQVAKSRGLKKRHNCDLAIPNADLPHGVDLKGGMAPTAHDRVVHRLPWPCCSLGVIESRDGNVRRHPRGNDCRDKQGKPHGIVR
mmetsp:Transcript_90827/g.256548  ORF Transcript_90827/g.256548 Transcript_90827/m.256548 type:complete len:220 (-) Transcript_90827:67-726(-)